MPSNVKPSDATLAQKARVAAITKLIDAHATEYKQLLGDERQARGLTRSTMTQLTWKELRQRVDELEAIIADLRERRAF